MSRRSRGRARSRGKPSGADQTFSEVTLDRCDGQAGEPARVYKTDEELADAIAAAYRTVIADLYAAGCRNIQFDDCTWGIYCDTDFVAKTGMSRSTCKR